jgi:hypothetical protein
VELERPRTRDLLTSAEFMRLKREALALLFDSHSPAAGSGYRPRIETNRHPGQPRLAYK